MVLCNTNPIEVHAPEIELRPAVPLRCGSTVPANRLRRVLGNALPKVVHHAEVEFGRGQAVGGQGLVDLQGADMVAPGICGVGVRSGAGKNLRRQRQGQQKECGKQFVHGYSQPVMLRANRRVRTNEPLADRRLGAW